MRVGPRGVRIGARGGAEKVAGRGSVGGSSHAHVLCSVSGSADAKMCEELGESGLSRGVRGVSVAVILAEGQGVGVGGAVNHDTAPSNRTTR